MRTVVLLLLYYGCVLYTWKNPAFGMLFFVHITIFRPDALVWGNLAFGRLHLIASLSTLLAYLIHKNAFAGSMEGSFQKANLYIFFYFVLWIFIVSIFAEYSVQLSLDKAIEIAKIFILCFLFMKMINTERRLETYIWVTSLSFGLLSFWGVLQGLAGNNRLDTLWPGGSNYIAAQLALIAPFTFAKVFDVELSVKYRLVFFISALWIVLCCVYTDSRGGFLGLSVGMLVLILQVKQRMRILAGIALGAALTSPFIPTHYFNRITSIFVEKEELDESAASRPVLWKIALRIWQDHPIAGVGLENFSPVKETYVDQVRDIVSNEEIFRLIFGRQRYTHGLYPGMMAEVGIVGTGLFLLLLLRNALCRFPHAFKKSSNYRKWSLPVRGAQAGLIGFAVAAIFGDFQYIEILYLQLFFVGAIHEYAASLRKTITGFPSQISRDKGFAVAVRESTMANAAVSYR